MKNNTLFKLFIILVIALLFRLWYLDKQYGLWNDEYVGWMIASENNIHEFIQKIFNNCHTPLYYLYLKFWIILFGDTDISLRYSSVIPGLISIPVIYKLGSLFSGKNTGLLAAFLTAISSFCIYFSQEVRLYSLLFLISTLVCLYFVKSLNSKSKIDISLYFIFNAILCAVHTLGIIFSVFNISIFIIYLYKHSSNNINIFGLLKKIIKYIAPFLIVLAIITPLLINITLSKSLSQFWSTFTLSKIFFNFTDYFSPVQTNISNSPESVFALIFAKSQINYSYIIFGIIPLIISLYAIFNAIKQKNTILNLLLMSAGLFYLSLVILSFSGKLVLSTKYSSEIYPILIISVSYGLLSIKKNAVKLIFTGILIILNLFYLFVSPSSTPKLERAEGNNAPVKLIETSNLKQGDTVIMTYYDIYKFKKYMPDTDKYNFISINKFNFNEYIYENSDYYNTIHSGKILYKDKFREFPNEYILKFMKESVINKMNKGDRVGIVFLNNVSFMSQEKINSIVDNEKEYKKVPFIFMVFSSLRNNLLYSFKDDFKIDTITQAGEWTLIVYEKTK